MGVKISSIRRRSERAKVPRKLLLPQSTEESPMMKKAGTRGEEEEAEAEGEVTNDEEADDRGGTGGALALEFEKSSSGS